MERPLPLSPAAIDHSRVLVSDKALINSRADVNAIFPLKYKWAWDDFQDSMHAHWIPQEVQMGRDIEQWNNPDTISPAERRVIMRSLGFFSTADSLVANNLVLAVYRLITNPECRQFLLRQASEESIHSIAYAYCVQSLAMDEGEVFNMYHEVPSVAAKAEWSIEHTRRLSDPNFRTGTPEADRALLEDLIAFYPVMEGIFFYAGFAMLMALKRDNKMVGMCEQIEFIMRDETAHFRFGNKLILSLIEENPQLWTASMQARASEMIQEGVQLEVDFARDSLEDGSIKSVSCADIEGHIKFVGDRRLSQLGLKPVYGKEGKPLKWMSALNDLLKEKNWFETTVTEYQSGGLEW